METDGKQKQIINLKGRGTAPLTDLIRIHALARGTTAQNSFDRLEAISTTQLVQPQAIEHLRYALEFLSMVRIRHQVDAIEQGQKPDNYIEPEIGRAPSELQSLMSISYAVFCSKKKTETETNIYHKTKHYTSTDTA